MKINNSNVSIRNCREHGILSVQTPSKYNTDLFRKSDIER